MRFVILCLLLVAAPSCSSSRASEPAPPSSVPELVAARMREDAAVLREAVARSQSIMAAVKPNYDRLAANCSTYRIEVEQFVDRKVTVDDDGTLHRPAPAEAPRVAAAPGPSLPPRLGAHR